MRKFLLFAVGVLLLEAQHARLKPSGLTGIYNLDRQASVLDVRVLAHQYDRVELGFSIYDPKSKKQSVGATKQVNCRVGDFGRDGLEYDCTWVISVNRVNARGGALEVPSYENIRFQVSATGAIQIEGGRPGLPAQYRHSGQRRIK